MMTFCNEKTFFPTSCEKIILFRHAVLLPKIVLPCLSQPSIDQSAALLDHINGQFHYQRGNNAPGSPDLP
jgi:hypothetical protein